jgi:hypothetical protein
MVNPPDMVVAVLKLMTATLLLLRAMLELEKTRRDRDE